MADEPMLERKLVTILSADVAEYSRLMAEDEEHTLKVFRQHCETFKVLVDSHHGRIFNTAGDAILAEFTSPVEAVRCATDIQAALRSRNDLLPLNRQVRFRIGVNLGDVMMQNNDLLGDGVNVAARLQGAAEPGGICLSGSVYDQIRNKLSLSFESLGEKRFKNIPQPVRTFSIASSEGAGPVPVLAAAKPPSGNSSGMIMAAVAAAVVLLLAGGYWVMRQRADQTAANPAPAGQTVAVAGAKPAAPGNTRPVTSGLETESSALLADAVRVHRSQEEIQALSDANARIAALAVTLHGLDPADTVQATALTAQMKSVAADMSRNETAALAQASSAMGQTLASAKTAAPPAAMAAATDAKGKLDEAIAAAGQAPDETASLAATRQAVAAFDAFNTAYGAAAPARAPARRSVALAQEPSEEDGFNIPAEIHDQIAQAKAADSACWNAIKADPGAAGSETCSRRDDLVAALKTKGWCGRPRGDTGVLIIWNQCQ